MAHTLVYGVCFSLYLIKSTSCLSLCLLLNSFCDETLRTWASLGSETRYHGFWLGLSPSHMGSSPKQRFGWVGVPATWVWIPNWVLAGFESQLMGSSPNLWLTVSQLDSSSHSATTATREKPEQQQDPAQPKISEEIKLYIYIYI